MEQDHFLSTEKLRASDAVTKTKSTLIIRLTLKPCGYKQEVLKAKYILDKNVAESEIRSLEQHDCIRGLTLNIIFDKKAWLSVSQLEQVMEHKQLFLRLVQSYSKQTMLIRVGYLWPVFFGKAGEFSFRKHRYWFNGRKNGDLLLTAGPGDTANWQDPLRKTIKVISALPFQDIETEMKALLKENIAALTFDNLADYFVKYTEFFTDEDSSCCLLPESGNLSSYDLMVCSKDWKTQNNPFCLAVAHVLGLESIPFGEINNIIEICRCVVFKISDNGNWQVTIDDDKIKKSVTPYLGGSDGNILFRKQGEDCIENAVKLGRLILSHMTAENL